MRARWHDADMNGLSDSAASNRNREYPAWGYLLGGVLFIGFGVWILATGALEDSRQPLLPWFAIAAGLVTCGFGAREWARNGSPTRRRLKSDEERRRDELTNRRILGLSVARLALTVTVVIVVVVLTLVRG